MWTATEIAILKRYTRRQKALPGSPSPAAPRRRLHPPQGAAPPGPAVCAQPVGEAGPGWSLSSPGSLCGAGNSRTHSASTAAPQAPPAARPGHEPGVRREGPGCRERRSVRGGTPPPRFSSGPRGPMVPGERGARLGRGREGPAAREVIGALRRGCPGSVGGSTYHKVQLYLFKCKDLTATTSLNGSNYFLSPILQRWAEAWNRSAGWEAEADFSCFWYFLIIYLK